MRRDTFIGKQIGEFIVQERVGVGTRSIVYRAYQPTENRDVALKVTHVDSRHAQTAKFRESFGAAIGKIAVLDHPHILPIYAQGIEPGLVYTAMPLRDGGTLDGLLAETPILDLSLVVRLMGQVGSALSYAHQYGVVHYDLKPPNILLDDEHNAYLTDFGVMKSILNEELVSSKEEVRLGGTLYFSPEQLRGEKLTPRSDVFCMGMMLYRMVAGRLPFDTSGMSIAETIRRHLEETPPGPRTHNPDVPPVLETIVMQAIAKDPADRFADTDELAETLHRELRALFEAPAIEDMPTDELAERAVAAAAAQRPAPYGRWLVPLSLGITAVVVLFGLGFILNNTPVPPPVVARGQSIASDAVVPSGRVLRGAQQTLAEGGFIAYVSCNGLSPMHAQREAEVLARAASYDLPLQIYDSQGAPELEIAAVQRAYADGAAVIIHCVVGETTIGQVLAPIADDGVPIVADNTALVGQIEDVVFVTDNNYGLGYAAGAAAGDYLQAEHDGTGDVIILDDTDPVDAILAERADGLADGLRDTAPDAIVLDRRAGATAPDARESVEALIGEEVDFDVLLTVTDVGAYGALEALEFAGYVPGDVAIYSVGAEMLAQRYIQEGRFIQASARPNTASVSNTMVDVAVNLLGGGIVPQQVIPASGDLYTAEDNSFND